MTPSLPPDGNAVAVGSVPRSLAAIPDEALARQIMAGLYEHGLFQTWYRHRPEGWTLMSGAWSPVYLQLRELCSHPPLLAMAGEAIGRMVRRAVPDADCLVGVAFAGIPLAVAASLASDVPAAMTRKISGRDERETEEALLRYGQHAVVEGAFRSGMRLVLVDDLVTGFDSKIIASQQVMHEMARRNIRDVRCTDVAVLIDREQGGAAAAAARGFRLHATIPLRTHGLTWLQDDLAEVERDVLSAYFDDPEPFMATAEQERLRRLALPSEGL